MSITHRLTYANVASTLALVVALGGGGAAVAASLAKNSVGSPQIKAGGVRTSDLARNSVDSIKVKKDALTGADLDESTLAQVPSAATAVRAENVHAALVQADGTLVTGQSLHAVSAVKEGTGTYSVVFDRAIADCAPVASIAYPGAMIPFPGQASVTGLEGTPSGLFVATTNSAGTLTDFPFSVMVVC